MDNEIKFFMDGKLITGRAGQTILEAAESANVYIPRLCHCPGLEPYGSCRVCTVLINGRPQSACTLPVAENMVIENESERVRDYRRSIIEMLFVEGNHFCMFCEKSGNCELQALAYRFGITAPRYPYQFPQRHVDASHPDVLIDHNRCVLCARCIRASRDKDGKNVFQFVGRGVRKRVGVNGAADLASTNFAATDAAADVCPVGAILKKRVGYTIPVGLRLYDREAIGSNVESGAADVQLKERVMAKPKIATTSLAGCFGCHMSVLDIDERILELIELVDFDKSPIDDKKQFDCIVDIGLIEGGCCNEENVKILRDFRAHCRVLISFGDCATMGGIPALRNGIPLRECYDEAYLSGPSVHNPSGRIPDDPELPLLLSKVYPCHEVVKIDYHLPGCPPSADTLWETLVALLGDKPVALPYELIKYD